LLDLIEDLFTNYIYSVNQYYVKERRLMKRVVSGTLLLLLTTSLFLLGFNTSPVAASGHIYIRANGSINPPSAHISSSDNITYVFTSSINDSIVVQRSNVIVDGSGYALQGPGSGNGFYWTGINNVTIMNVSIENFGFGVLVSSSSFNTFFRNSITANKDGSGIILFGPCDNNIISENNITNNFSGIYLDSSCNNSISRNNIASNYAGIDLRGSCNNNNISANNVTKSSVYWGIYLDSSCNNSISGNSITENVDGVLLGNSNYNNITGNNITANEFDGLELGSSNCNSVTENLMKANGDRGIYLIYSSNYNSISRNSITANYLGISHWSTSDNRVFHNNFINNTYGVGNNNSTNVWDDGYPSGGNYWSSYTNRTDDFRGVYQNITGSDGIADAGYTLPSTSERDRYPLMGPFGSQTMKGTNVTVFPEDEVCLIFDNVTGSGSTSVNETAGGLPPLPGYVPVGSYYNVKVSATFSGKVMIRIIYNDTGLTLEQETSLTMSQWNATGDVDFSGKVDLKDVFAVGRAFGSVLMNGTFWHEPHRSCCPHSANADLNGDGKVDLKDYYRTCKQFGKAATWADITTYVDTENNVIYGETDHFSSIGIHRPM
jgi:parallel beta-helix repeat protein